MPAANRWGEAKATPRGWGTPCLRAPHGANSTSATIPLAPRGLHAGRSTPRSERPGRSSLLFPPGNTRGFGQARLWPRGFGQATSPELNGEPGARKFTCQPETSVPNADAWPELLSGRPYSLRSRFSLVLSCRLESVTAREAAGMHAVVAVPLPGE